MGCNRKVCSYPGLRVSHRSHWNGACRRSWLLVEGMSSQTGEKGVQKQPSSKHRPYLQSLKAVEAHAAVLQQTLQQEQQRQQDIVEHNLVLSELAFTQGRLQAIHEKQQQWKLHGLDRADQVQGLLATSTAEPDNLQDAHWVVNLLETATPQQLQQALLMTCEDWTSYHRQYCHELTKLVEVDQRCPEVQAILLDGWQAVLSAQAVPAAYASKRLLPPVQLPSPALSDQEQQDPTGSSLATEVIIHLLKTTGTLVYLALLQGLPAIFKASSINVHTGLEEHAPALHWVQVATRMRFSRQQKLHFRLAIQTFKHQVQALGQQGMAILQETPSYAFLLACQNIAARQQSSSEDTPPQAAGPAHSADPSTGSMSNQRSSSYVGSGMDKVQLCSASPAAVNAASTGAAAATAQGEGAGAAAAAAAAAALGSLSAGDVSMSIGYDDEDVQAVMDAIGPSLASEELQRTVSLYYRLVINVNIFLADTLTLEQALLLNVASYPYWPMLLNVAEAALQLPEEQQQEAEQERQGIQQLMSHRRSCMQRTHFEWFGDYGKPDGGESALQE